MLIKLLNKDFIYINNSLAGASILFMKKPDEELWFYINYHALNKLIKKNWYLFFLINEILE